MACTHSGFCDPNVANAFLDLAQKVLDALPHNEAYRGLRIAAYDAICLALAKELLEMTVEMLEEEQQQIAEPGG